MSILQTKNEAVSVEDGDEKLDETEYDDKVCYDHLAMICDFCENVYHAFCVGLDAVPDGDWFCKHCEDTVSAQSGDSTVYYKDDSEDLDLFEESPDDTFSKNTKKTKKRGNGGHPKQRENEWASEMEMDGNLNINVVMTTSKKQGTEIMRDRQGQEIWSFTQKHKHKPSTFEYFKFSPI